MNFVYTFKPLYFCIFGLGHFSRMLAAIRYFLVSIFLRLLLGKFLEFSKCACGRHFPAPLSPPPFVGQSLNAPLICVASLLLAPKLQGNEALMCFGLVPGKKAKANISLDAPNESGRGWYLQGFQGAGIFRGVPWQILPLATLTKLRPTTFVAAAVDN